MKITITYPESWAQISYKDYMQYYNSVKPYDGTEQMARKNLEAGALYFCKVPAEYLYKLPNETFAKIEQTLTDLFSVSTKIPLSNQFEIFDTTYGFVPNLDNISYGEYLDLVSYTSKDLWENIPIVMSILYRPVKLQLGKNYTIQPYTGTDNDTIEMFREKLNMEVVFGATSFFFEFISGLTDRYPSLFQKDPEAEGGQKNFSPTAGFGKKWAGYHSIAVIANNDLTKFDYITDLNVHKCLTFLVYLEDYNQHQSQLLKQAQVLFK